MSRSFLFISLSIISGIVNAIPGINKPMQSQYGFIENKGQIIDQNNQLNPSVLYLYNGNGLHVQLKQSGFSYEVIKPEAKPKTQNRTELSIPSKFKQDSLDYTFFSHRIDISFVNANQNAKIISSDVALDYINYYTTGTSEAGVTNVHHYKKVLYQNIYNNIDVEFLLTTNNHEPSTNFKYNFIVHPGGDPNDIQLKFDGANNTSLTKEGHITIETAYGNIDESIPLSYQLNKNNQQQEIATTFRTLSTDNQQPSNVFGINVGDYDKTKLLVIDPVPWTTYFGGPADDGALGSVLDASGNIFISGRTSSTTAIATSGAYQTVLIVGTLGANNAFISKFSNSGSLLWATYYGGNNTLSIAITCDLMSNIYITGSTYDTAHIATSGAFQATLLGGFGGTNAFIAKFDQTGARIWSTYFGGSQTVGYGITVSGLTLYVIGTCLSNTNIASSGSWQTSFAGGSDDGFIVKFDIYGSRLWSTYYGGMGNDGLYGIATDLSGNIYAVGSTSSTSGISTTGSYHSNYWGNGDAFIVKFSGTGSRLWATYLGGMSNDMASGVTIDANGYCIVTGTTYSTSLIASSGAFQTSLTGSYDAFVAKFNSNGSQQWSTYFGGNMTTNGRAVTNDNNGNIFATGTTTSNSGIASIGSYQTSLMGSSDAYIVKFDSSGNRLWSTYYGGTNDDDSYSIGIDNSNNIFIAGYTTSTSNLSTTGAYQTTFGGFNDAFVAAFTVNGMSTCISNNSITSNQLICSGASPNILIGSIPIGGRSAFTYLWLSSTTSSVSGFTLASGRNDTVNYAPPNLTLTTWYRRVVISYGCPNDTSLAIAIVIVQPISYNVISGSQTVCLGSLILPISGTTPAGGNGINSYQWQSSTANSSSGFVTASGTSNAVNYFPNSLTTTTWFRRIVNSCAFTDTSASIVINVNPFPKPNVGFTINNAMQCVNGNNFIFTDT